MSDSIPIKQSKIQNLKKYDSIFLFEKAIITHKIDGTNARIYYDGESNKFKYGSKNRELIPGEDDNFNFAKWVEENIDKKPFRDNFEDIDIVVFGEFFKNQINGRVNYGSEPKFRVFDIYIGTKFLDWKDVIDVSNKLNLEVTPYERISNFNFEDLKERCKGTDPLAQENSDKENKIKEGIVIRPPVELVSPRGKGRYGERIMYKVKNEKFEEINKGTGSTNDKDKKKKFDEEEIKKIDKYITENRIINMVSKLRGPNPSEKVDKTMTGDVIKEVISDIRKESKEELNDQVLGKYGGGAIANKFQEMIQEGVFENNFTS